MSRTLKQVVMGTFFLALFLLPTNFNQAFALGQDGHIGGSNGLGVGSGGYEAGGYHAQRYWHGGNTGWSWDPNYSVRNNYNANAWPYAYGWYGGGPYPNYYYSYPAYYVNPSASTPYYNSQYDYTKTGNRAGTYYYVR